VQNFTYQRAENVRHAIELATAPSAAYIAGGTELLNWMRLGIAEPERVIDIGRIGHRDISVRDGQLIIGALATLNEVGSSPLVIEHAAVLSQACLKAASPQVRNRATIGGNVMQKTRCTYFRSEAPVPWPCNKRVPGSGCAARHGLNERHAIVGWTDACVAVHPSDPLVALACLDAQAQVVGASGSRSLKAAELHLTQQEARTEGARIAPSLHEAQRESRLLPDEIIVEYRVPIVAERSAYIKVRERESYEYALVSAAAALRADAGRISRVRLALGSVAQRPIRLESAERALAGVALTREAILPALREALAPAKTLEHNRYKIVMATNAAARAILAAGGVA
jgi:xanthine dehydrogenase YagS FAD-binding subunit